MEKLKAMVQKLAAGGVEFVVVGGYAAVAHGASLMTRDADIFSVKCRVLSLDALIRAKQAMSRTQDWLAVIQLQTIHERLSANLASGNRQM